MRTLICLSFLVSCPLFAQVPTVQALVETDPIPAGFNETDDTVIWLNAKNPEQSRILGTSKYDVNGQGGLGVYDLQGHQLQFFSGSKLNSVDIVGRFAVASNRSEKSFDVYEIDDDGVVTFVSRTPLSITPYGLCLDQDLNVYLPTKSGVLYQYGLDGQLRNSTDLAQFVTASQDAFITSIVEKEAKAEGEEGKLAKHLEERFILEGCVVDKNTGTLYVGMENLGIWALAGKRLPELVIPVQGSWTDIADWEKAGQPRVTDDIEGLDILQKDGRSYMIFSSQGISEFTVYDLQDRTWVGNFKATFGTQDAVTFTDGVSVLGSYLGKDFPEGALVVHDDENTGLDGALAPGNYKVISLADVWKVLPIAAK